MGLLYGEGDLDQTIVISTRCGQDSDCNPSNSGGILGTVIGRRNLPEKFTRAIDPNGKFSHTPYTFPALVEVSEKLVRQAVVRAGGRIEKDDSGNEVLVIPVSCTTPEPAGAVLGARPGGRQPVHRGGDGADHCRGRQRTSIGRGPGSAGLERVKVELLHQADGWSWEAGYWAEIGWK